MTANSRHFIAAVLVAALTACGRNPSPPTSAPAAAPNNPTNQAPRSDDSAIGLPRKADADSRTIAALMRATFGVEYDAAKAVAWSDLPNPTDRESRLRHRVSGEAFVKLADGQTLLIASAKPGDEETWEMNSPLKGAWLNLYWLRQVRDSWQLLHKEENIDEFGTHGNLGHLKVATFASGETVFAIEPGGTWEGYTVSALHLFLVEAQGVRGLTKQRIPLYFDDSGACDPGKSEHCQTVEATWQFVARPSAASLAAPPAVPGYPDLLLRITGETSDLVTAPSTAGTGDTAPPRRVTEIRGEALYRFQGGAYTLVKGKSVPARD
jgi:hypothetical protein